jgi:hypothetical protein
VSVEASEIVSIEGSLLKRGKLVSDHLVRSAGASWQEIEALPQPLRWTVQRTIFHLLDEPVPTLAALFPVAIR